MRKLFLLSLALLASFSSGVWGAINNTTVTKPGGTQKYIDVTTTAASNGDEVTVAKQYIAYTMNELISSAIKDVWYTQSSGTSGSSNSDAVAITGYRTACNKYIPISSSKKYTHYVTNCVSFSALYDPRSSGRYCTITATNVDDAKDVLTITNSGTVASGTKYNVELTGLSASKYYRVVVETNNGSDSRIYQIRLEAPSCSTEITTQPSGATIAVGDANPELSIVATDAASYAWKESSDGTSYDGASSLGSSASFTPSVNDAVQTKYYYCEVTSSCDGAAVSKSDIVTVNVVGEISYYTVTLNPAGGTIVDATGWTLNAGNYEKEVAEGTVLTLPTFTKTDRTFKTWRKAGPADVASPVTVDGDLSLTAIWTATIEQVIYSWEGAEGGASEVGGTVEGSADNLINQVSAGYYCLKIDGNDSYSGNLVTITLSGEEKIKTGDKIKYWGFYYKNKSANARPKMRDANGSNASIFDDPNNLPNLYSGGDPAERTFTVPASINTNAVQLTRSQTGSNTWISKLQIIREVQVEEGDLLTVTFNYNDGVTPNATIQVASGQAVAKPADPTWAHHRFNEWQLAGSAYDFSSAVTADITLVANWTQLYTITYAAGDGIATGDAPTQVDKAAGETFTVAANTFAVEGKDFVKWNDGTNDYAPNDTYTVGSANVVLTAQWEAQASDDATLKALSVAGLTLAPAFAAETENYTVTKAYGADDPAEGDVTATPAADGADVDVAWDGTNKKFTITVTALDNTTKKTYTITVNEAEAPKSLSRVLFSNGFDAFIDNTNHTVKAYYLAGQDAPTATTITAGAGTAGEYAEGKITVTGADDSTVDYIVTLAEVTPNTTSGAAEAAAGVFAGDEAWVKNGLLVYGNTAGYDSTNKRYTNRRLKRDNDPDDDQRVIAGWVRSYFFVGNASKFIMTVGGNKNLDYAIDGGTPVENVNVETLEIALTKGNHMIEIVSHQTSGDCYMSAPKLVEITPGTALDNTDVNAKAVKRLENGILVIEKNGRLFNAQGQLVK